MARRLALLVAMGLTLGARPGLAQFESPSPARPEVLLLLDSSLSWENHYVTGAPPDCTTCAALGSPTTCTTDAVGLQEGLTGTYDTSTMTCDDRSAPADRPDLGLPVGHFRVQFPSQSMDDGALDLVGDAAKFGLMTVDHAPDTTDTLAGEFSYPATGAVSCSWEGSAVTFNVGAKSENATYGRFVPIPASDDPLDVLAGNQAVQQSLNRDIPWGTFPAAALLSDALSYVAGEPHFAPWDEATGTGDPYHACRERAAVLITHSGEDDTWVDAGAGCLSTSLELANELALDQGVPLYTIAYRGDAAAIALADELAAIGGTEQAFRVNGPDALKSVFATILDQLTRYGASYTQTAITSATRSDEDAMYMVLSGYGHTQSSYDPYGVLYELILQCHDCTSQADGGPEVCDYFEFGAELADHAAHPDATRTVLTQVDGVLSPFTTSTIDADTLSIPNGGWLIDLRPTAPCTDAMSWNPATLLGQASHTDPVTGVRYREIYADQVVSFVRGDETSRRCNHPLGAIRYATPAISAAPSLSISAPGYGTFKNEEGAGVGDRHVKDRPTVLYAATHTGLLHAFRIDRPPSMTDDEYGQELWAYEPGFLLPRLQDLPLSTDFLLDGSVVVRDVLTLATSDMSLTELGHAWRTVLVATCGTGCRGAFALDVTEPDDPQFLWEIEPGRRCYANAEEGHACEATNDYDDLGYTVSKPDLGQVWVSDVLGETGSHQRGVVILGAGAAMGAGGHAGNALYVLDALSGRVLREFGEHVLGHPAIEPAGAFDQEMVGGVAGYNTFTGRITTRAFAGDGAGQLWRFDISGANPADWSAERFFDVRDVLGVAYRPPMYEAPALALDATGSTLIVTATTGGVRALDDATATHAMASVREAFTSSGGTATLLPQRQWAHVFDAGEIPTRRPVVYNSVTYFTTYRSDLSDPCLLGSSRVYGVGFVDSDAGGDFVGALDVDDAIDRTYLEFEDTFLSGVQVVLRPGCIDEVPTNWASPGGTSGEATTGTPSLVASAGFGGTSSPSQVPATAQAEPPLASKSVPLTGAPRNLVYSSWGLIFE